MNELEMRQQLLDMGRELITEMRKIIDPINRICCKIEGEAGALLPRVADQYMTTRRKGKVVYKDSPEATSNLTPVETPKQLGKGTGKRACSICRQPGHRSSSCPRNL